MKKFLIFAVFAAFGASAVADDAPRGGAGGHEFGMGGFVQNLTEEQKACIEKAGCPKSEMKKPEGEGPKVRERGAKPERPEMTDEDKEAMKAGRECMQKAFSDCGIQMPERPEGGKPPFGGKGKPQG
jgi:hypothetical protein